MTDQGTIASVDAITLGSDLVVQANVNDTTLAVTDSAPFFKTGGYVALAGVIYTVTLIDDMNEILTLGSPVTTAASAGEMVTVWDNQTSAPAVRYEAAVVTPMTDNTGDPILATVRPGLVQYLPLGPRDQTAGNPEACTLSQDEYGIWWVDSISGRAQTPSSTYATTVTGVASDPLQQLIQLNGLVFATGELTTGTPIPLLDPSLVPSPGLVWHDTQSGSPYQGEYFVYTGASGAGSGSQWSQITNANTLTLVGALPVAVLGGISSAYVNLYVDPLSHLITGNSAVTNGASTASGPSALSAVHVTSVALDGSGTATLTIDNNTFMNVGRSVVLSGFTTATISGTTGVSVTQFNGTFVLTGATGNKIQFALAGAAVAQSTSLDGTPIGTPAFMVGDIALETFPAGGGQPSYAHWLVYNPQGAPASTWADWVQVTNPLTLATCANLASSMISNMVSTAVQAVAADIAAGTYGQLAIDLNLLASDVLNEALAAATPYDAGLVMLAGILDSTAGGSTEQAVVIGADGNPTVRPMGSLADTLLAASSAHDIQVAASVTGNQWTGTDDPVTGIPNTSFLATYIAARGGSGYLV